MMKKLLLVALALMLNACSSYQIPESPELSTQRSWAIMPMENHSNTPLAAEKVEQILRTQLYAQGVDTVKYPATPATDLKSLLDSSPKQKQAQAWLATQAVDYVITGSVEEWHYKSGLDGEPAVGITLEVKSAQTGETLWQASGSRGGWGRESVSGAGQTVIKELVEGLNLSSTRK